MLQIRKQLVRWWGVLLGVTTLILAGFSGSSPTATNQFIKAQYIADLARLDTATVLLRQAVETNKPTSLIQQRFLLARLAYKRTEWLTEFYFPVSAKQLNGPPVPEGELDDGVGMQIEPDGFQMLEELLFPYESTQKADALARLSSIQQTVASLRRVSGFTELNDAHIFDALRLEVFRIVTMSISGFDSPVAIHSLPESIESLKAIRRGLVPYSLPKINPVLAAQLDQKLDGAIHMLNRASFDTFDRLTFIRNYANPLGNLLVEAQLALNLPLSTNKRFLSPSARTLTEPGAFNPMFFAPYGVPAFTPERVELGKMLFASTALSAGEKQLNGSRSCASCHQPERAFTDGLIAPLVMGSAHERISRNTPTLYNAALQGFQFLDSREFYLEDQIANVMTNSREMGGSLPRAIGLLATDSVYIRAFGRAYPAEGMTELTLKNALAHYVRSLTSLNSRFDRYVRNESVQLSAEERHGFNLFMGKAKCGTCHYYPLFNGTLPPAYIKTESEVIGTPATADEQAVSPDSGRYVSTKLGIHHRAFKIPSVRHIAQTAPYMHNGAYQTLEQVVEFYNKGGGLGLGFRLDNQTLPADKLNLTPPEKKALVAFMKTL